MKILQLTKKVPYPLKDGESIAVTQLAKGLIDLDCKIDLLSFNSIKHYIDDGVASKNLNHYNEFNSIFLDNRVKIIPAFINLFKKDSYNITRFSSIEYSNKLIELLNNVQYDVIIIESLFMCVYIDVIKKHSNAKIVMRSHNIEYKIWERLSLNELNPLKKWYLNLLSRRLETFEYEMSKLYDLIVPISPIDEKYYKSLGTIRNTITIPTGIDSTLYSDCRKLVSKPIKFFFIGSLDWAPNIEGLKWFINTVWINKTIPAEFYIAGRNCPKWLKELDINDIFVIGEVESAQEFMCSYDIMVVPLFSGSGIRIKILESMAIGKAVLTTSIGCEGIADENSFLIANSSEEFKLRMNEIYNCSKNVSSLSNTGQKYIFNFFNNKNLSFKFHKSLIELEKRQDELDGGK